MTNPGAFAPGFDFAAQGPYPRGMHFALVDKFTPRASPRNRILSAAIVWTGVGSFLTAKGFFLLHHSPLKLIFIYSAFGAVLGLLKSRFIFDRVAAKIITHIGRKPMPACLGGLFSFKNWALILVMILFGRVVGSLPLDQSVKSVVYVMVGSGLAYSSRLIWRAWKAPAGGTLPRL